MDVVRAEKLANLAKTESKWLKKFRYTIVKLSYRA